MSTESSNTAGNTDGTVVTEDELLASLNGLADKDQMIPYHFEPESATGGRGTGPAISFSPMEAWPWPASSLDGRHGVPLAFLDPGPEFADMSTAPGTVNLSNLPPPMPWEVPVAHPAFIGRVVFSAGGRQYDADKAAKLLDAVAGTDMPTADEVSDALALCEAVSASMPGAAAPMFQTIRRLVCCHERIREALS